MRDWRWSIRESELNIRAAGAANTWENTTLFTLCVSVKFRRQGNRLINQINESLVKWLFYWNIFSRENVSNREQVKGTVIKKKKNVNAVMIFLVLMESPSFWSFTGSQILKTSFPPSALDLDLVQLQKTFSSWRPVSRMCPLNILLFSWLTHLLVQIHKNQTDNKLKIKKVLFSPEPLFVCLF